MQNIAITSFHVMVCHTRNYDCNPVREIFFNSLPNNKVLDWSELKAFADDKLTVAENLKFIL